jgi:NAD(P)-dependent dehydrogenase (short-subunit alcohol dehydrogenase family)
MASPITTYDGAVAVITGGASGVGRALARRLRDRGASVVIADVEQAALDATVADLQPRGPEAQEPEEQGRVHGVLCDVTDPASVEALADAAYGRFGKVNLLFNNAGVGAPSAKAWETTPNDYAWVFGVNVYGVAHGIQSFVPRMLAGGEPGFVANTTSGDGAVTPMPTASVYAASKAGVAIITECLAVQLEEEGGRVAAGLLFPAGQGLISTGMWTADRNRPARWERERERPPQSPEILAMKERAMEAASSNREHFEAQLDALADAVLEGILAGDYVLTLGDFDNSVSTLRQRADRYARRANPVGDGAD